MVKKISFCIPCYQSQLSIADVVKEIDDTMETLAQYDYEIVLVDDHSPDDTLSAIRALCEENPRVMGVHLARNFGQHAALMAGMQQTTGDVVVCLDDDGQTPASEVGKLLEAIEDGYDVVYAKYINKLHSRFRNFGTKVNELMTRIMLGKPKELQVTSYFAARRFVVDNMLTYQNSFPYVIGLVLRATKNIKNVEVTHRERNTGTSGYTLKKLFGLWFNGFTAFSIMPLRIATLVGSVSALGGFGYGIYIIIRKLVDPNVVLGFSSIMAAIVFFCGMIMIMLGLIGEYIGRIYISMNNSPQYLIKEIIDNKNNKEV